MKESRLFQIVYHLIDKQVVTANQLAQMLEVSVRTIYRDIEQLSAAGIPLYTIPGRRGGLALLEGFTLDKMMFSSEERDIILSSLQNLEVTGASEHETALRKLSVLFGKKEDDWLEVDFSRWGDTELHNGKFKFIKEAILNRHVLQIAYCNNRGEHNTRIIEPLKLLYKAHAWYVKSFSRTNQGYRIFKLTRILEISRTSQQFDKRKYPPESSMGLVEYTPITLRFTEEMAFRVYDEFPSDSVHKEQDGSLLLITALPLESWMVGYILSFGSSVEVLEPAILRQAVIDQAKNITSLYKP